VAVQPWRRSDRRIGRYEPVTSRETAARRDRPITGKQSDGASRALVLAPWRGLGGGIERYVETLEWAFMVQGVPCQRLDLSQPGLRAHLAMLASARALLRTSPEPTRLVVGHRALMPVATLLAREPTCRGISVVCHGVEGWSSRFRIRRSI
jgi:phosphatidylinositol alpha-1,6-mannosyltransferase